VPLPFDAVWITIDDNLAAVAWHVSTESIENRVFIGAKASHGAPEVLFYFSSGTICSPFDKLRANGAS
jgi:hypothetical protein